MKFFIDTEFVEDGATIELISIAIVSDDDRTYCAINSGFDQAKAANHPFVNEHVLPHVMKAGAASWKPKYIIAREIKEFVGDNPEFWGDYASYDWVALCQLYGPMVALPAGWPFFIRDVQQFRTMYGLPEFEDYAGEHDALEDANECRARYHAVLAANENRRFGGQ